MSEIEQEGVKKIWFGMQLHGNWIRNHKEGTVTLFSAEEAHEIRINPNIPMSWWNSREFVRYKGE